MDFFIIQTLSGVSFASVLFLLSSGLSLIFGVMNIVNVSHGSYYMLGGYIGLSIYRITGNFLISLVGAALAIGTRDPTDHIPRHRALGDSEGLAGKR